MFEEVAALIGKTAALRLQAKFGGRQLYVPCSKTTALRERDQRINRLYRRKRNPVGVSDLMAKFSLSRRHIWNILSKGLA